MGTIARKDIKIKRGDDFTLQLRLKYYETDGALAALDLTGSTLTIQIDFADGSTYSYPSTGSQWTISSPTSGEATFTLSDTVTDGFPTPRYKGRWTLKRTIGGNTTTHIAGSVIMLDWTAT